MLNMHHLALLQSSRVRLINQLNAARSRGRTYNLKQELKRVDQEIQKLQQQISPPQPVYLPRNPLAVLQGRLASPPAPPSPPVYAVSIIH